VTSPSVLAYRSPRARQEATAWLGMVIFLGSWAVLFAALFFAYGVLRAHTGSWPPAEVPRLPVALPLLNTAVIALASGVLQVSLAGARAGRSSRVTRGLAGSLALGVLFLALQGLLWKKLWDEGLRPEGGPYPSVFYALTVFHALHVMVGLGGLAWALVQARNFAPARHLALRLWTAYWHFVCAVWGLLFVAVFVL